MFGFKSSNEPLRGQDATTLRATMERLQNGTLNSEDKARKAFQERHCEHTIVW